MLCRSMCRHPRLQDEYARAMVGQFIGQRIVALAVGSRELAFAAGPLALALAVPE